MQGTPVPLLLTIVSPRWAISPVLRERGSIDMSYQPTGWLSVQTSDHRLEPSVWTPVELDVNPSVGGFISLVHGFAPRA